MSVVPTRSRLRKWRIALIIVAVLAAALWGGYEWLLSTAKTKVNEQLSARGLCLKYSAQTWSPLRGLTLKDAVLCRSSEGHEPLIEITSLHLEVLWREAWRARAAVTRWRAKDATLTLHDGAGAVTLQHFTTDFVVRDDKIDVAKLDTNSGPLAFALAGQILTAASTDAPPDAEFALDLKPLRAVLGVLDVKGPFAIAGTFALDLRSTATLWNADLRGSGKGLEWRGVPMEAAEIDAKLSQAALNLGTRLKFTKGSANVALTRAGWEDEPLIMSGTVTDSAGQVDEFTGSNQGATDTLTINSLSGSADLLELARNLPALAAQISTVVSVKTFPDIVVKDLVWQSGVQPPQWSLASLQLRTPGAIVVMVGEHPLPISQLTGRLSYERGTWQFEQVKGQLPNGRFVADGDDDGSTLNIGGTVTDSAGRTDEFKGRHQRAKDIFTINRLTGNADLLELARNLPALAASVPTDFKIQTFPDIAVQDLVWQSGAQPPQWSLASLKLRKPAAVVVMVRNRPLTVDNLTGQLSYDHDTWQFDDMKGRLLGGTFALTGNYDGQTLSKASVTLQTLHLARLSPWVGQLRTSLRDSVLSFAYSGAICNEPIHSTGKGTLKLTNVPQVHVPLLDQAYQLFPKIIPSPRSGGMGDVDVEFSLMKGMATIEPMKVRGQSVVVTARGTVDLNKRVVDGRARANLRGVAGVALSPVSVLFLEMQISGPLDNIRVSPLGALGAAKGALTGSTKVATGTVKLSTNVLREGLSVPFEALGMFNKD